MKVLDLQCENAHVFEGWFASEDDFASQQQRGLVACPMCGASHVSKKLSAPRLNLGASRQEPQVRQDVAAGEPVAAELQAAWLALARRVLTQTEDVGERFPEEARRIHYGESEQRGIRGQASHEETQALLEEGISVMPLALPDALKGRLQ
jgi:hypothetical protein